MFERALSEFRFSGFSKVPVFAPGVKSLKSHDSELCHLMVFMATTGKVVIVAATIY